MTPDEEIKERFLKGVESSGLSDEDKAAWKKAGENMPLDFVVYLTGLFETSPEDIAKINSNFKEKKAIVESQDKDAWDELLKKEKKELEKLTKDE